MAGSSEIKKMLQDAEQFGFTAEMTGSTHWRVIAPEGVSGPKGTVTVIACSPRSPTGVRNALAHLRGIGYVPPKHREAAQRKRLKQEKAAALAALAAIRPQHDDTDRKQDTDMAPTRDPNDRTTYPFGELISRVTQPKTPPAAPPSRTPASTPVRTQRDRLMPREDILSNLPLAAELVWQTIQDKINSNEVLFTPGPSGDGIPGFRVEVSRGMALNSLWPGLVGPSVPGRERTVDPIVRVIGDYLRKSHNMRLLEKGNPTKMSVWWVSQTWNPAPVAIMNVNTLGTDHAWWERKVTPEEAGENRPPAPVTVTFREPVTPEPVPAPAKPRTASATIPARILKAPQVMVTCTDCSFKDVPQSVGTHKAKFAGREHPQDGAFQCPLCPCVRPAAWHLWDHVTRGHKGNKRYMVCRFCGDIFDDRPARNAHMTAVHGTKYGRATGAVNRPAQEVEVTMLEQIDDAADALAALTPAEPALTPAEVADIAEHAPAYGAHAPADITAWLREFLDERDELLAAREAARREIDQLTAQNAALTAQNVTLTSRVEELGAELIRIEAWLRNSPLGKS